MLWNLKFQVKCYVSLPGPKNCEFCVRDIQANTVCLSVNKGADGEMLSWCLLHVAV